MRMGHPLLRLLMFSSLLAASAASTFGCESSKQKDLEPNKPYGIITAQPLIAKDCVA